MQVKNFAIKWAKRLKKNRKKRGTKRSAQQLTTGQSRSRQTPRLENSCWTKTKAALATKANSQAYPGLLVFALPATPTATPTPLLQLLSPLLGFPLPFPCSSHALFLSVSVFALIVKFFIRNLYS